MSWPGSRGAPRRWWPPPSAPSSPSPMPLRWPTQLDSIAGKLGRQFPAVETMLREAATDVCAFTAFPVAHWKKVWSTNPLERVNKEIMRRTDVVGIFPNKQACCGWPDRDPPRGPRRVADRRAALPLGGLDGEALREGQG